MNAAFPAICAAALAILNKDDAKGLTRKAGSFLGQCCVDPTPLTEAQAGWLSALQVKNGFAPLGGEQ